MLSYSITILISYISMMYSKRKTLHYITKEMYFLCNSFVTTRPYPLIFMDNRLIHRIVQKKIGERINILPRFYYCHVSNDLLRAEIVEMQHFTRHAQIVQDHTCSIRYLPELRDPSDMYRRLLGERNRPCTSLLPHRLPDPDGRVPDGM